MTDLQLQEIKEWFECYVGTFASGDGSFHSPLQLKVDHSKRVADNAQQLAEDLGWNPSEINRAEALGWLHDVGRFSQFAEFGTFTDATSVNHGERGWEIVRETGILSPLKPEEQNALLEGIRYHNAKAEPDHLNEESLRFLKLIRDADKLDLFHFVLTSIQKDGFRDLPDMLPQVVLNGPVNPKVIHEIQTRRTCSITEVRSLSDFLLMQLSWIYDLNYSASFRQIIDRNIIDDLERELPGDRRIGQIIQAVSRFAKHNRIPE
ncbi:MAG: HD domain-containing protein [Verrucomicrobia bacterium]|nr:HD domain-containing protein [Verrucomicrobiota bacterium]